MEEEHIQTYYLVNSEPLWSGTAMNFCCNCLPESLFHFHCNCLRRPLSPQISTHLSWISESEGFFLCQGANTPEELSISFMIILKYLYLTTHLNPPVGMNEYSLTYSGPRVHIIKGRASIMVPTLSYTVKCFFCMGPLPLANNHVVTYFFFNYELLTVSLWCTLPCES